MPGSVSVATKKREAHQKAEVLCKETSLTSHECELLIKFMQTNCKPGTDRLDKMKLRDILIEHFEFTDSILMDQVFKTFDTDSDGFLTIDEWVKGMSVFLRGSTADQSQFCFKTYDMKLEGSLTRDVMFTLLKSCLADRGAQELGEDDPEEGVKDLIETVLKKMDIDKAVVILVSNALRVAALNTIGTFVIFLCKAGVSAIVAAIGLIWFKNSEAICSFAQSNAPSTTGFFCEDEELNYYFVPAVCAAIFAYFAASCFFGVFDLVLDTLLVCVSEDSHENDAVDAPHECKTLKAKPEFMRDLKDAGDQYDTVKSRKKKEPKSYNVELQGEGEKQGGGGGGAENADENV